MIGDSEYHWRQVRDCADGAIGGPLSQRPYLDTALRSVGYVLDGDPDGATLRAICREAIERRMMCCGEDD